MGKLIKNHWARLICLTAAACTSPTSDPPPAILLILTHSHADQIAAALCAFFWPKFFFDFYTKNFDAAVKPIPILQTVNLVLGIISLAYEWPLKYLAGTALHRSMEARMLWLPLVSLSSVLLYQATNPAVYYAIGCGVYFWGYTEGEVICAVPWTLPKRSERRGRVEKA
ncbi:uncharacterized protein LTR77_004117 [Saxophila tyrrhenica]|uniref:DUF7727 domain-containing protein n=1 Tax=Saxophila tyrrhenica TaxID=1690608 RepID=A0AAV9PCL3_9PEZI|nr:hypothetical protein LTR77_004117 [Saxophila tyrrhenica]